MAYLTNAPRGTQDVLPPASGKWQYLEETARDVAALWGFGEIRIPTFEHTELFSRSVGDTTDVVQKEMYTFNDKAGRSITLRPEGTAGVMRAILQNGMLGGALPLKLCYLVNCFRYEKPQAGRLREFHQFGVEMAGAASHVADAQVIGVAKAVFDALGVTGLRLELNSIGCPECRARYHEALKAYFASHLGELCETCRDRLERNPMRILDCKSPVCSAIAKDAPKVLDYICGDCRAHFEGLKKDLDAMGVAYTVNPTIVRGLDYYTRTVFEVQVVEGMGSQNAIGGGGRYDKLAEEVGGRPTPGFGFALGYERCLLALQAAGVELPGKPPCDIFVACVDDSVRELGFRIVQAARDVGLTAELDHQHRSLKSQFKLADKIGAVLVMVLGPDEVEQGVVTIRNMQTHHERTVELKALRSLVERFLGARSDSSATGQLFDMK